MSDSQIDCTPMRLKLRVKGKFENQWEISTISSDFYH